MKNLKTMDVKLTDEEFECLRKYAKFLFKFTGKVSSVRNVLNKIIFDNDRELNMYERELLMEKKKK